MSLIMSSRLVALNIIIAAAVFLSANQCYAGAMQIKTEGSAMRSDDEAAVKAAALNEALKKAVEAAVKSLTGGAALEGSAETLETSIYPNHKKYVLTYRMLATGWITDLSGAALSGSQSQGPALQQSNETYRVWIEASVDAGALAGVLKTAINFEMAPPEEARVIVLDAGRYLDVETVKAAVDAASGGQAAFYESFSRGRAVLRAAVPGGATALYSRLSGALDKRFVVAPGGSGEVIVKAERR